MTVTEPAAVPQGKHADLPTGHSSRERWLLGATLGAYLLARTYVWSRAEVFSAGDSSSYAPRGDATLDHGPLVSLVGGSPRPWGVPMLYALVSTDAARVAMQFAIGSLAWGLLAYALWRRMATPFGRFVATSAMLVLALTTSVSSWDYMILSESLSISLGALTLALLLLLVENGSWFALIAFGVSGVWWVFTRPDVLVFSAAMVVGLTVLAWRVRARRWRYAAAALALTTGMGWFAATMPAVDRNSSEWMSTGEPQSRETLLYRLYLQVLPDPMFKSTYENELGLPVCPAAERVPTNPWDIVSFGAAYSSCPDLVQWANQSGSSSAFRFVLTSPGGYGRLLGLTLPEELSGSVYQYGKSVTVLPAPVQRALFPPTSVTMLWTVVVLVAGALACALSGAWRRRPGLVLTGAAAIAAAMISACATVLFSAGAYSRYGIQEAVLLRLGVIILVAAAIDSMISRRLEGVTVGADRGTDAGDPKDAADIER